MEMESNGQAVVVAVCLPVFPARRFVSIASSVGESGRVLHRSLPSLQRKLDAMRDNTSLQSKCRLLDRLTLDAYNPSTHSQTAALTRQCSRYAEPAMMGA
jgi:hypothetical protein